MSAGYTQGTFKRMREALEGSYETPLHTPARIGWAICTFGYTYPRRRVGENVTVCIFRTIVIFVTRLGCILGTIWYLHNLVEYLKLGDARPYNVLSIENESNNGTVAPVLNIFSANENAVNLTSMSYHDLRGEFPLDPQLGDYDPNILVLGSGVNTLDTKEGQDEYMQYILRHDPLYASEWTRVGLIHPNSTTNITDSRDFSNQYYFYPGHIVEIRYEPLEFHTVNRQSDNTNTLERFTYFLGFGGETVGYSYKSSVTHMPFPATRPAAWDNLTTVIIIRPASIIASVSYNEEKTSIRATLLGIGGLLGIVSSIIVFLFGVSVMSPWGFIAGIPYFRRRITGSLAEAYTSQGGLSKGPFTTDKSDIGKFEPGMSTEMRVAMVKEQLDELELVLMEYYIDGAVFQGYDQERTKVKVLRAASMRSRMSGVDGQVGSGEQGLHHSLTGDPLSPSSRVNVGRGRRSSQLNDRTHFAMDMYDQQDDQQGLLQQDHHSMHQTYLQNTAGEKSPAYPPRPPKDEIISMHLQNDDNLTMSDFNHNSAYYNNSSAPAYSIAIAAATTTVVPTSTPSPPQGYLQDPVPSSLWWKEGTTLTETIIAPRSTTTTMNGTTAGSRPVSVQPLNPTSTSFSSPPPSSSQQQQQEQNRGLDLSNLPREF
ncbi:hypothetical protein BGX30_000363 [Mortierella sp. GBA39]|nr:hypothetical protein BGX30_000363 [Mortierella sp. GBA39]